MSVFPHHAGMIYCPIVFVWQWWIDVNHELFGWLGATATTTGATVQVGRFCRQRGTHWPPTKPIGVVDVMDICVAVVKMVTKTVVVGWPILTNCCWFWMLKNRPSAGGSCRSCGSSFELLIDSNEADLTQSGAVGISVIKILSIKIWHYSMNWVNWIQLNNVFTFGLEMAGWVLLGGSGWPCLDRKHPSSGGRNTKGSRKTDLTMKWNSRRWKWRTSPCRLWYCRRSTFPFWSHFSCTTASSYYCWSWPSSWQRTALDPPIVPLKFTIVLLTPKKIYSKPYF